MKSPDFNETDKVIPCDIDPYLWTDATSLEEKTMAERMCLRCPLLGPCRDYAAPFKWFDIVIGGWIAPKAGGRNYNRYTPGHYPPWSPLAPKPKEAAS